MPGEAKGPFGKQPANCYARRGSPYWWYRFKFQGKSYRGSTGYEHAAEADEYVRTLRARLRNEAEPDKNVPIVAAITGEHYQPARNEMDWAHALQRFHDDMVEGAADERNSLRRATMLLTRIGNVMFHDISHAVLFDYRNVRSRDLNRYGDPISQLTVNRDMAHCRQVFNHMADLGVRMPKEMPKWAKLIDNEAEMNAARTRHLSTEEEDQLFAAIERLGYDWMMPFIEFLILCGQRKAAVINLCRSDIDWQARCFKVLLKGKGKKKREHIVPLTPRMEEIIRAQPEVEGTDRVFTYVCRRSRFNKGRSGYLRKRGERYPLTLSGWNKVWQELLREADIDDFRVHDLRHTNATRVVRATGNIRAAQQVLGHRQMSTTARYANLDTKDAREALKAAELQREEDRQALRHSKKPDLKVVGGREG